VPEELLSEEEAALVFRRAAELEATSGSNGTLDRAGFDASTLERIATEAGLSPAAVRQALAELRTGRLATRTGKVGPGQVVVERRLRVRTSTVTDRVESYFRQQQFRICRRGGSFTVWEPNRSLQANLTRGIDLADRMRLAKVDGIELLVHDDGEQLTHVRIVLDVGKVRSGARFGAGAGVALAASGVAGSAIGVAAGLPEIAFVLPMTTGAGAGWFFGSRSNYAKQVKRAVDAIELLLDELEHGVRT
jgi:hypothetical protein